MANVLQSVWRRLINVRLVSRLWIGRGRPGIDGANMLRALRYLSADRVRALALAAGVLFLAIPVILVEPFLVREATQRILQDRNFDVLLLVVAMGVSYYAARVVIELLLNYLGLKIAYRVHLRVLHDSMHNFLSKDLSLVKSLPRGDVLYCFFNDSMRVASFASSDLMGLASNVTLLISCFGLMLYFNAALAMPCLAFFVALSALHIRLSRNLVQKQLAAKEIDQTLSGRAQNMLSGIVTLKAFGLLDPVLKNWMNRYRPRWDLEILIRMTEIALTELAVHAHIVFTFVILFLGLHGSDSLAVSVGGVFAFLVVYNRMAAPFHYLISFYLGLQDTKASLKRYFRLYDLKPTGPLASVALSAPRPFPPPTDWIEIQTMELRGVATWRGDRLVRVPNLTFDQGKSYLLTGPNGCGKSTTGLIMAGLLPITQGIYRVNECTSGTPYESCKVIYLEKEGYWPEGTILDNLFLSNPAREIDEERIRYCLDLCRCTELIEALPLGIRNPVAMDWNLLSDGESQKLFLGFALYHEPQLLILDEALCHVPFETRKEIFSAVRKRFPRIVLILISHHAPDIDLVDHVVEYPARLNQRDPIRQGGAFGSSNGLSELSQANKPVTSLRTVVYPRTDGDTK